MVPTIRREVVGSCFKSGRSFLRFLILVDIPEQQSLSIKIFSSEFCWGADEKMAEARVLLGDLLMEIAEKAEKEQQHFLEQENLLHMRERPVAKKPRLTNKIAAKILEEEYDSMIPKEQKCEKWVALMTVLYDKSGNERRLKIGDGWKEPAEIFLECSYRPLGVVGTGKNRREDDPGPGSSTEEKSGPDFSGLSGPSDNDNSEQQVASTNDQPPTIMYMMRRFPPKFARPELSGPLFLLRVAVDELTGVYNTSACRVRVSCSPAFSGTHLVHNEAGVTIFESGFCKVREEENQKTREKIDLLKHHRVPGKLISDILNVDADLVEGVKHGPVSFHQAFCFLLHDPRLASLKIEVDAVPYVPEKMQARKKLQAMETANGGTVGGSGGVVSGSLPAAKSPEAREAREAKSPEASIKSRKKRLQFASAETTVSPGAETTSSASDANLRAPEQVLVERAPGEKPVRPDEIPVNRDPMPNFVSNTQIRASEIIDAAETEAMISNFERKKAEAEARNIERIGTVIFQPGKLMRAKSNIESFRRKMGSLHGDLNGFVELVGSEVEGFVHVQNERAGIFVIF